MPRYEVRVVASAFGGEGSRFELERDHPLEENETFIQLTVVYKVLRIAPTTATSTHSSRSNRSRGPGKRDADREEEGRAGSRALPIAPPLGQA